MHYIGMLSLNIQSLEDYTIVCDNQSMHYVFISNLFFFSFFESFISNLIIILHKEIQGIERVHA